MCIYIMCVCVCLCYDSSPENRKYGHKDPSRFPRYTLFPQKLALTSWIPEGLKLIYLNYLTVS
jgi:hypothetical protein